MTVTFQVLVTVVQRGGRPTDQHWGPILILAVGILVFFLNLVQ